MYWSTEHLILKELELIKENQRNINIDLYHIKLDISNLLEGMTYIHNRIDPTETRIHRSSRCPGDH